MVSFGADFVAFQTFDRRSHRWVTSVRPSTAAQQARSPLHISFLHVPGEARQVLNFDITRKPGKIMVRNRQGRITMTSSSTAHLHQDLLQILWEPTLGLKTKYMAQRMSVSSRNC
jgi:hypothetical protein